MTPVNKAPDQTLIKRLRYFSLLPTQIGSLFLEALARAFTRRFFIALRIVFVK